MLNKYYEKHKDKLRHEASCKKQFERYQKFIEEEREKKCQCYQERK